MKRVYAKAVFSDKLRKLEKEHPAEIREVFVRLIQEQSKGTVEAPDLRIQFKTEPARKTG